MTRYHKIKMSLVFLVFIISTPSSACKFNPVNTTLTFIEPCVSDQCLYFFIEGFNNFKTKHCLAKVIFKGATEWAYFPKSCSKYKPNKTYQVRVNSNRCYKDTIPMIIYKK